jgi:hypothetical protein
MSSSSGGAAPIGFWWLVPVKDLLQVAIWFSAFTGNRIEWAGQKMKLRPDGDLEPAELVGSPKRQRN